MASSFSAVGKMAISSWKGCSMAVKGPYTGAGVAEGVAEGTAETSGEGEEPGVGAAVSALPSSTRLTSS